MYRHNACTWDITSIVHKPYVSNRGHRYSVTHAYLTGAVLPSGGRQINALTAFVTASKSFRLILYFSTAMTIIINIYIAIILFCNHPHSPFLANFQIVCSWLIFTLFDFSPSRYHIQCRTRAHVHLVIITITQYPRPARRWLATNVNGSAILRYTFHTNV